MGKHPEGHVFYRKMDHSYPIIERGEGVYLYDRDGRKYLDASGGPLVVNLGHGIDDIADAIAEQARQIAYVHGMAFSTAALETYSHRLAHLVPIPNPRFYYQTSGAEAVDTALKFVRQAQVARGEKGRHLIISRWGSYHGATLGTLGVSSKPSTRRFFEKMFLDMPHVANHYCYRCPFQATYPECDLACARQLEDEIVRLGPHTVAAFIAEPVGGNTSGALAPPLGYWELAQEICERYEVMLIADEVLTGFGRTGTWFACEHYHIRPDVITVSKGLTGGYFPLSVTGVHDDEVERIRLEHGNLNQGGTYSHHAVGLAAAGAALDYMEDNDLVARARAMGLELEKELVQALSEIPCVGQVRGIGMMWAVEFVRDIDTRAPFPEEVNFGERVCSRAREMGVLFYPGKGCADGRLGDHLMIAPPFIVTAEETRQVVSTLREAILDVYKGVARSS